MDLQQQPDKFSRDAGIRPAAPNLFQELRYVKELRCVHVHFKLIGLQSLRQHKFRSFCQPIAACLLPSARQPDTPSALSSCRSISTGCRANLALNISQELSTELCDRQVYAL